MEPTVVGRAVPVHRVDGMDGFSLACKIVFPLPDTLVVECDDCNGDYLKHHEELYGHRSECSHAAAFLDCLSGKFTRHDEGEGHDWNEETQFFVRDSREDNEVECVVIGQVGRLILVLLRLPMCH